MITRTQEFWKNKNFAYGNYDDSLNLEIIEIFFQLQQYLYNLIFTSILHPASFSMAHIKIWCFADREGVEVRRDDGFQDFRE